MIAASDTIFWVDNNARTISSIKRDLTERKVLVENDIVGVEGIAVDWIAGNYTTGDIPSYLCQ